MIDPDDLYQAFWEELEALLNEDPIAQLLIGLADVIEAIYGVDIDTWKPGEGPDEWNLLNAAFDVRFDRHCLEARRRWGLSEG
ncbi:MAG: hypothetical protein HYY20_13695 [Candidatus Tectomicrobia bacterium]|uniref:Uncharacterized protein n=1 Tax=Tectimicrobiota bacterium TaxID=2528274 RepID=A0A932CRG5_UNCTE|nr:hypothetical protein [Candidatus Tectomicrobia bacterium]